MGINNVVFRNHEKENIHTHTFTPLIRQHDRKKQEYPSEKYARRNVCFAPCRVIT